MTYRNRNEAGRLLAAALLDVESVANLEDPVVLGVVRGGLPVAFEVAQALGGELGPAFATKIGAPGNPELAVGALADEEALIDHDAVRRLRITPEQLEAEIDSRRRALDEKRSRLASHLVDVSGRNVIVVDDGVATGHTTEAVLLSVARAGASEVILAVPVGPPSTIARLASIADVVVCPLQPAGFGAVGLWYEEFGQLSDADVASYFAG